ncbi:signal peptidase I [Streptomyces sp. NPDC058646]|uniref:signal peptidase I n=1 Tax=Streptomyces sp. NPDC058646 TaxID=3346574 RepID=UPI0036542053
MEHRPGRRRGIWAVVLLALGTLAWGGSLGYGVAAPPPQGLDMLMMAGDSMRPTYGPGERVWFLRGPVQDVRRGDVVWVRVPWLPGEPVLERVVAVGGDRISYARDEPSLRLNGEPLDEPYLKDPAVPAVVDFDVTVPDGQLFLMGDNRFDSADSSLIAAAEDSGTVEVSAVHGRTIEAPVGLLVIGAVGLAGVPLVLVGGGLGIAALVVRSRRPAPAQPVHGAVHVD